MVEKMVKLTKISVQKSSAHPNREIRVPRTEFDPKNTKLWHHMSEKYVHIISNYKKSEWHWLAVISGTVKDNVQTKVDMFYRVLSTIAFAKHDFKLLASQNLKFFSIVEVFHKSLKLVCSINVHRNSSSDRESIVAAKRL